MPHVIEADTLTEAFIKVCQSVIKDGKRVQIDRDHAQDNDTIELCPAVVRINKPSYSTLLMNNRAPNPFATLYETLWVLSGSNNIETLKFFIPRAPDYADNDTNWRAGYGPRLRSAEGSLPDQGYSMDYYRDLLKDKQYGKNGPCIHGSDQIDYIVGTLSKDPSSRRAIMTIWDPVKERDAGNSKDYPCNIALHFIIRDNALNLKVMMRSNDALYGFSGINVYEWTFLQTMLAGKLGVDVGWYEHHATSLHVYANVIDKVTLCADTNWTVGCSIPSFFSQCSEYKHWNSLETSKYGHACKLISDLAKDKKRCKRYLEHASQLSIKDLDKVAPEVYLSMYLLWKNDKKAFGKVYASLMEKLKLSDMKLAVAHFFNRNTKGVSSDIEYIKMKGMKGCVEEVVRKITENE